MMSMKTYFPKLDSIRFYAFLVVLISHIFFFCYQISESENSFLKNHGADIFGHGEMGVHIFFTLSGFLIMFLAIGEYRRKNHFSILGFFKRRILRIWPVYTVVLGSAFIFLRPTEIHSCMYRFWYFLGNTCMVRGVDETAFGATIGPLWSVSVEEQFYVIFPFVFTLGLLALKKWRRKTVIVIGGLVGAALLAAFIARFVQHDDWKYISYSTLSVLPSLVLGMELAVVLSVPKYFERLRGVILKHPKMYSCIAFVCFVLAIFVKFTGAVGVSLYILILYICTALFILLSIFTDSSEQVSPTRIQKTTRYLGRISYGLYAYHMFAILFVKYAFEYFGWNVLGAGVIALLQGGVVAILTIGIAHISYKYMEKWFLSFK